MSRIDELIALHCPDEVEFKTLGNIAQLVRGNGMPKTDLIDEGVGAIHYGQIYTRYGVWTTETLSFVAPETAAKLTKAAPGDIIITNTSENLDDVGKAVAWLGTETIVTGGHATVIKHAQEPKYLAYWFASADFSEQKRKIATGTKVIDVSAKQLATVRIPVPPLEVQREIVRVLDQFTQLEAELEAELEARRRQYEHYRTRAFDFSADIDVRWSTLGEISTRVSSGATPKAGTPEYYDGGTIPWLRTGEVTFGEIWDTEMKITDRALKETGASWIKENCVIVAISGATAARSAINKIPLTTNQHCCNLQIDDAQANYRYVFFWVSSKYEELKAFGRGARSDLNAKLIKDFPIPVPSLDEQRRIVSLLDKFDALVNDLSVGLPAELAARRKQYEYYRDKLLTFEAAVA